MKKLFTTLALFAGLSISGFAQNCYTGPTGITPGTGTTPGLSPSSENLPCAIDHVIAYDTIYFTNFTSFSGFPVSSLTIDSIGNLPNGTCWVSNKANNTFAGGENGVIYVHGLVDAAPGQYTLQILFHATAGAITLPPYSDAAVIAGLHYWVRVSCADSVCAPVDTTVGKTTAFIPYNGPCPALPNGINEVTNNLTNVSVMPNPFTNTATVTFNSEVEGTFTVKMMNLLGAVVSTKEVNVTRGSNQTSVERNGLSSGIYILSIANGNGSISKKVIID
jgi:hypothetical protein